MIIIEKEGRQTQSTTFKTQSQVAVFQVFVTWPVGKLGAKRSQISAPRGFFLHTGSVHTSLRQAQDRLYAANDPLKL